MTDQSPNGSPSDLEARIAALERKSWRSTMDDSRSGMETAFWALFHALFPEEARKIHFDEAPARAIHGEATPKEAQELDEEGVPIFPLPRLPEDQN